MDDITKGAFVGIGGAVMAGLLMLALPLISAAWGYFTGWVLVRIFPFAGQWVVTGASALGAEIGLDNLPAIGAALGFAGSFFRARQTNTNKCK